jgi:cytochrome b561
MAHQWLAWIVGLVVGHIGAALKHHLVDKDGVLGSMLPSFPGRKNRSGTSSS